jgi:hypothetical protein
LRTSRVFKPRSHFANNDCFHFVGKLARAFIAHLTIKDHHNAPHALQPDRPNVWDDPARHELSKLGWVARFALSPEVDYAAHLQAKWAQQNRI